MDLGAALLMPDYKRVLAMAAEVGATTCAVPAFAALRMGLEEARSLSIPELIFEKHGIVEFFAAACRYLAAHHRYSEVLKEPGFAGMSATTSLRADCPALSITFGQWAGQERLEPLLTQFQLPFAAFGYGDVSRLPAAYVLRYIRPRLYLAMTLAPVLNRVGIHWPRRFEHGFGEFWKCVAEGFDIRLNARVETIHRDGKVSVAWMEKSGGQIFRDSGTFDALVVACPPEGTAGALAWSRVEARLFGRVRTERYSVTVCETTGIPETVSFLESPGGPGHLIQLWKPAAGRGPCAFYTSPPAGMAASEIMALVREDLRRIYPHADAGEVIAHVDWPYFPHVDAETFAAGYFDDFEAMQGDNSTWYGGSLPAFETAENVVAYSENLVDRLIRAIEAAKKRNTVSGSSNAAPSTADSTFDAARVF